MHDTPNREIRGPAHDTRARTTLEKTLEKTASGRAWAKTPAGKRAIQRERERRGLRMTSGAFDGAQAPKTPTPATAATPDAGRPVALLREDPVVPSVRVNELCPYGEGSPYSEVGDELRVQDANRAQQRAIDRGQRISGDYEPGLPAWGQGSLEDVRRRLRWREQRDVTAASGGAGLTIVSYLGQSFDNAVRAEGRVTELVTLRDLPADGMTVGIPRLTTGTSVAVQAGELQSVNESNPVSVRVDGAVVTMAGFVDCSRQLIERAGGTVDAALGEDLGRDVARLLDQQVIDGSGSSGEMQGLLQTSGITSLTWSDVSPTVAEWRAQMWKLQRDVISGSGWEPDVIAWHQTRAAWAWSGTDTVTRQMVGIDLPAPQTVVASIPTTKGAGTNEDRTLMWNRQAVHLFLGPPTFTVDPDVGSGTGTVRVMARRYAALVVRRPEAVGVLAGTGTVVPTL